MPDFLLIPDGATLVALEQHRTYAGLIEGFPNRRMNQWALEHDRATGHLIEPVETPIPGLPDFFGGAAELPAVRVQAQLQGLAQSPDFHLSKATIIWYQSDWAPPVDAVVQAKILALTWSEISVDFNP